MSFYNPGYQSAFQFQDTTGVNLNDTTTVTPWLDVRDNNFLAWQIISQTGTVTVAVTQLEVSYDETNVFSTTHTLTGNGIVNGVRIAEPFIRIKCTTAQGGTSLARVMVSVK